MADALNRQIKAVEDKIAKVEGEIEKVAEQLERIVAQLEDPELRGEPRAELLEREKRLGKREEQLREEKLLMAKQQPPGIQITFASTPMYCVYRIPDSRCYLHVLLSILSACCVRLTHVFLHLCIGVPWQNARTSCFARRRHRIFAGSH